MNKSSTSKVQRSAAVLVLISLLLFSTLVRAKALRTNPHFYDPVLSKFPIDVASLKDKLHVDGDGTERFSKENVKEDTGTELYPTGSSLPDCSHACGACVPCKRVMVSYKCATESCPVVYRCMCKGKYYHVPSN